MSDQDFRRPRRLEGSPLSSRRRLRRPARISVDDSDEGVAAACNLRNTQALQS
jgi:hypothetical protein